MTVQRPAYEYEIAPLIDRYEELQEIDRLSLPMQACSGRLGGFCLPLTDLA